MTRKEIENVINHINEKQLWINRLDRSIERHEKANPVDERKIADLEERSYSACLERNGMIWALRCATFGGIAVKQKTDSETPCGGLWYWESV